MTDNNAKHPAGWVFYDGECVFCVSGVARWGWVFERRGFVWLPLQSSDAVRQLGTSATTSRDEMKVRLPNGGVTGGIDAWAILLRSVWWLWPIGLLLQLPGVHGLGNWLYRWVANHRYCFAGRCLAKQQHHAEHSRHDAFFKLP